MQKWLDKYEVLEPDHINDLERSSALLEFHHGQARPQAEELAYGQYKRNQLAKAAGFHLDGMAQAKSRGDKDAEHKHYGMYAMHCHALGLGPFDPVSAEIGAHRNQMVEPLSKFVAHPADAYVLTKELNP